MSNSLKKHKIKRDKILEDSKSLATAYDFDSLFDNFAELIKNELDVDLFIVLVIKDDKLIVNHINGYNDDIIFKNEEYRIHEDLFTEIIDYGKPIVVHDSNEIRQNIRYANVLKKSGSTVLLPVTIGNEISAIVQLSRNLDLPSFTGHDIETSQLLADGTAIAMSHIIERGEKRSLKFSNNNETSFNLKNLRATFTTESTLGSFFEIEDEKQEKIITINVSTQSKNVYAEMIERTKGIVDIVKRLQGRVNNLSFFSLSLLLKMPASEKRDSYINQFKDNPFSSKNLQKLFEDILLTVSKDIIVNIVKRDIKKRLIECSNKNLSYFLLDSELQIKEVINKCRYKKNDLFLAIPKESLSLDTLKKETFSKDLDETFNFLNAKIDEQLEDSKVKPNTLQTLFVIKG